PDHLSGLPAPILQHSSRTGFSTPASVLLPRRPGVAQTNAFLAPIKIHIAPARLLARAYGSAASLRHATRPWPQKSKGARPPNSPRHLHLESLDWAVFRASDRAAVRSWPQSIAAPFCSVNARESRCQFTVCSRRGLFLCFPTRTDMTADTASRTSACYSSHGG